MDVVSGLEQSQRREISCVSISFTVLRSILVFVLVSSNIAQYQFKMLKSTNTA